MFVGHQVTLNIGYPTVRLRLARLMQDGRLLGVSGQAYAEGLVGMIRVGPFGDVLGASKLVQVRMLDPVPRVDGVALPLRWEATGAMGRLFPVLDADLVIEPADGQTTSLKLTGAYRPPLGSLGARLDRAVLHHAATATVRSLLKQVADILAEPDDEAGEVFGAGMVSEIDDAGPATR
ncbi:MAG: hypothetical protein ACM3ML_16910 [Micromonosporaceae bacterium]